MSRMLAIDPGRRAIGWALFCGSDLDLCGLIRANEADLPTDALRMAREVDRTVCRLVIERMRVYPIQQQKGDQNDLLDLSFVSGVVVGVVAGNKAQGETHVELVTARDWKGQVPKDVVHKRILAVLSSNERLVLEKGTAKVPASLRHNVLDAVGIGLWACSRLTR